MKSISIFCVSLASGSALITSGFFLSVMGERMAASVSAFAGFTFLAIAVIEMFFSDKEKL